MRRVSAIHRSLRTLASLTLVAALGLALLTTAPAQGQDRSGTAIGGQIGSPAGLTLKIDQGGGPAIDLLAAFDLDNFFFLNGHLLFEESVGEEEGLHVLYGPGAFVGIHDRPADRSDEVGLGLSGTLGLGFYVRQFEIYLRVTPRLEVLPSTGGDIGGGLGARWFF